MRRYFPGAGNSGTTSRSTTPCTSPLPSSSAWCSSRPTKGSARRRGRAAPSSCCGEPVSTVGSPSAASAPPVDCQVGQDAGLKVGGVTPPDMRECCQQSTSPRHVTPRSSPPRANRGAPRSAAPTRFRATASHRSARGVPVAGGGLPRSLQELAAPNLAGSASPAYAGSAAAVHVDACEVAAVLLSTAGRAMTPVQLTAPGRHRLTAGT